MLRGTQLGVLSGASARVLRGVNQFLTTPLAPVVLVLIGSLGTQVSAVLVKDMLVTIGAPGVSGLRMAIAALIMLALFRPSLRGITRARVLNILVYSIAIAGMNVLIYQAIARLPQGVAVTVDFLGPCVVSFLGLKLWRSRLWAVVAFIGVALIAQPSNNLDPVGLGFAACGAVFFGFYTLFSERVGSASAGSATGGSATGGIGDLSFSVVVAAVVLLPVSIPTAPLIDGHQWALLAISGLIGAVLPFTMDTIAAAIVSASVVGTLFALDPVIGAILGWALSGDRVTPSMFVGIALIAMAGAIITWRGALENKTEI